MLLSDDSEYLRDRELIQSELKAYKCLEVAVRKLILLPEDSNEIKDRSMGDIVAALGGIDAIASTKKKTNSLLG